MEIGIIKDISREYIKAVELYEECISRRRAPISIFTNLAFLYWEFAAEQISFNKPNNIPDEWSLIGGKRFGETIEKGLKEYPGSLELKFWQRYFPYRLFLAEFTRLECEQLIEEHNEDKSLVPFFYLYIFDKEKYKPERDKLLELCKNVPTAKFTYIKSIIT